MSAHEARNEVYVAVATGTATAPIAAAAFGHSWVVILGSIPCGALVGLACSISTLVIARRRKPLRSAPVDKAGHITMFPPGRGAS